MVAGLLVKGAWVPWCFCGEGLPRQMNLKHLSRTMESVLDRERSGKYIGLPYLATCTI